MRQGAVSEGAPPFAVPAHGGNNSGPNDMAVKANCAAGAAGQRASRRWLKTFLARLGETSNVTAAAQAANISLSAVYKLRREDAAFASDWYGALAEGYDNLEMELLQHLRAGDEASPATGAARRKFDAATAFRCLAAHRDSVAREKGRRTLAEEVATIAAIDAKIDRLRLNEKAATRAIAAARKGNRARVTAGQGPVPGHSQAASCPKVRGNSDGA